MWFSPVFLQASFQVTKLPLYYIKYLRFQVRNLIVEFAKQKEPGSEEQQFGRFFHSQLDSILRDSLIKFNGRKLKECGEDLLIDVSEILFNELAFFKLMQDLDRYIDCISLTFPNQWREITYFGQIVTQRSAEYKKLKFVVT